jgi:hypothetical protein
MTISSRSAFGSKSGRPRLQATVDSLAQFGDELCIPHESMPRIARPVQDATREYMRFNCPFLLARIH